MMNSFWWGRNQKERKGMNWAAWDILCLPKSEGGLAFKNLHHHNVSLIAEQAWRLLSRPQSLVARIFEEKYFPLEECWRLSKGQTLAISGGVSMAHSTSLRLVQDGESARGEMS